jgi:hypothetical protein
MGTYDSDDGCVWAHISHRNGARGEDGSLCWNRVLLSIMTDHI